MYLDTGHPAYGTGLLGRADVALYMALTLALLIFVGVVLPAVWSAKPARRSAATAVLQQILDFLRGKSQ